MLFSFNTHSIVSPKVVLFAFSVVSLIFFLHWSSEINIIFRTGEQTGNCFIIVTLNVTLAHPQKNER